VLFRSLGQHSIQVLVELGYSLEEIEALREAGVIYTSGDEHGNYADTHAHAGTSFASF